MGKRVLLLNASYNDERMILALRKLDCYIITTGNRPNLIGHKLADEYVYGDYTDLEAMLQLAKEKKVDAVMPCCNDFGVKTAAYVSEKLGFKGQDSYETVLTIHDKDKFKVFAKELGGINTPLATHFDDEETALAWAKEVTDYPVIVKPVDLSAGNGIKRANDYAELDANIRGAFAKSRLKKIVVEPFIEGTQHSICTFLINQKVAAWTSNNENSFINPYRVEVDTFPSVNIDIVRDELIEQIEHMARALNLTDGIFELQYIFNNGHAHILECMRRVLGGLYSIPAEGIGQGFDWDYWEVKARCGFGVEDFPKHVANKGFWAYRSLVASKNGTYRALTVPDDIRKYVYMERVLHTPGYEIDNHMSDPVGFLFMNFDSQEEMQRVMVEQYDRIVVEVD